MPDNWLLADRIKQEFVNNLVVLQTFAYTKGGCIRLFNSQRIRKSLTCSASSDVINVPWDKAASRYIQSAISGKIGRHPTTANNEGPCALMEFHEGIIRNVDTCQVRTRSPTPHSAHISCYLNETAALQHGRNTVPTTHQATCGCQILSYTNAFIHRNRWS